MKLSAILKADHFSIHGHVSDAANPSLLASNCVVDEVHIGERPKEKSS